MLTVQRNRRKYGKAEILSILNRSIPVSRRAKTPIPTPAPLAPLKAHAGLEPQTTPLTRREAEHLIRRTQYGATPDELAEYIGRPADQVVDELVNAALALPNAQRPDWADTRPPEENASEEEFMAFEEQNFEWLFSFTGDVHRRTYTDGLREKLTLLWHNHFVTEYETYFLAAFAYRYVDVLRRHALGNFKAFVREIGTTPAMLFYLDGYLNVVGAPNENYARELVELFTMGIRDPQGNPNYTEHDIEEMARALTGWTVYWQELQELYAPWNHDNGSKTFFGRTGNFGYDDVINIIFEERAPQIANFIARKIYKEFVYATPNEDIVVQLAQVFLDNDFEIAPVIRTLLKSAHFFEIQVIGARIKSPVEQITGFLKSIPSAPDESHLVLWHWLAATLDQWVLQPPNVAGWPGHHFWVNTSKLPQRWDVLGYLLWDDDDTPPVDVIELAEQVHDPNDPHSVFRLAEGLAAHLLPIQLEEIKLDESSDPFGGDLISNPIPDFVQNGPPHLAVLAKRLLLGTPWYEWDLYRTNAEDFLKIYMGYLLEIPEYQLV